MYMYIISLFYLKLQLNVVQYGTYDKINFDFFFKDKMDAARSVVTQHSFFFLATLKCSLKRILKTKLKNVGFFN